MSSHSSLAGEDSLINVRPTIYATHIPGCVGFIIGGGYTSSK
jgi:hypothetical protein